LFTLCEEKGKVQHAWRLDMPEARLKKENRDSIINEAEKHLINGWRGTTTSEKKRLKNT